MATLSITALRLCIIYQSKTSRVIMIFSDIFFPGTKTVSVSGTMWLKTVFSLLQHTALTILASTFTMAIGLELFINSIFPFLFNNKIIDVVRHLRSSLCVVGIAFMTLVKIFAHRIALGLKNSAQRPLGSSDLWAGRFFIFVNTSVKSVFCSIASFWFGFRVRCMCITNSSMSWSYGRGSDPSPLAEKTFLQKCIWSDIMQFGSLLIVPSGSSTPSITVPLRRQLIFRRNVQDGRPKWQKWRSKAFILFFFLPRSLAVFTRFSFVLLRLSVWE